MKVSSVFIFVHEFPCSSSKVFPVFYESLIKFISMEFEVFCTWKKKYYSMPGLRKTTVYLYSQSVSIYFVAWKGWEPKWNLLLIWCKSTLAANVFAISDGRTIPDYQKLMSAILYSSAHRIIYQLQWMCKIYRNLAPDRTIVTRMDWRDWWHERDY